MKTQLKLIKNVCYNYKCLIARINPVPLAKLFLLFVAIITETKRTEARPSDDS